MTAIVALTAYVALVGFFVALIMVSRKFPPFMDPAIREDREVEALEAVWALPSRDPEQTA